MARATNETRNPEGQYDFSSEKLCTCGHPRGVHSEHGKACFAGDEPDIEICDCERFRKARK